MEGILPFIIFLFLLMQVFSRLFGRKPAPSKGKPQAPFPPWKEMFGEAVVVRQPRRVRIRRRTSPLEHAHGEGVWGGEGPPPLEAREGPRVLAETKEEEAGFLEGMKGDIAGGFVMAEVLKPPVCLRPRGIPRFR